MRKPSTRIRATSICFIIILDIMIVQNELNTKQITLLQKFLKLCRRRNGISAMYRYYNYVLDFVKEYHLV